MKMISKIMHACFKVLQKKLIYGQYVNVGSVPGDKEERHVEYKVNHS